MLLKKIIKRIPVISKFRILSYKKLELQQQELNEKRYALERLTFIVSNSFNNKVEFSCLQFFKATINEIHLSKSQLFQDLFVLYCCGFKQNGFFVEFGATNGLHFSNTYLLEKKYNWNGILSEPAKIWQKDLKKNRLCAINSKCVWTTSGEYLKFDEAEVAELSTISSYSDADYHSETRSKKETYQVETISLNDLLAAHNAPKNIDYLSIDTEGSEYEILSSFNFSAYTINIITVEHNYSDKRHLLKTLLNSNGYERVFENISLFDDWYIKKSLLTSLTA